MSTGPKSESGKDASRRNAVKHGLTGAGVVLPDRLDDRLEAYRAELDALYPADEAADRPLVEQAALALARMAQLREVERDEREASAERAASCWELDRAAEAEALAARLDRDPSRVAAELRRTAAGCSWLISRWEGLAPAGLRLGRYEAGLFRRLTWAVSQIARARRQPGRPPSPAVDPARLPIPVPGRPDRPGRPPCRPGPTDSPAPDSPIARPATVAPVPAAVPAPAPAPPRPDRRAPAPPIDPRIARILAPPPPPEDPRAAPSPPGHHPAAPPSPAADRRSPASPTNRRARRAAASRARKLAGLRSG